MHDDGSGGGGCLTVHGTNVVWVVSDCFAPRELSKLIRARVSQPAEVPGQLIGPV